MSIETLSDQELAVSTQDSFIEQANIKDQAFFQKASQNRLEFWEDRANELSWQTQWDQVLNWQRPYAQWFINGKLNACENCVDIHLKDKKNKIAIRWEGEDGSISEITYQELYDRVNQLAFHLKSTFNVKKGDRVTIYMPMILDLAIAVLACARIGAIHSVIFGGFSSQSISDRIVDSESSLVITADGGYRRGATLPLHQTVHEALKSVQHHCKTLVFRHLNNDISSSWNDDRDTDYEPLRSQNWEPVNPEPMDSEDILFILYTSGTTGKPKGIIHTTGGYMTHAKYSTRAVFDLKDNDIYWCTADVGWITGHTYLIYGPLANGATILMYEGAPDFPDKGRFWKIIQDHKVTILYTAPTAIRAFMKWGVDYPKGYDLSTLRLLGTVGEPINPEAWDWYFKHIGGENCPIVDTWWQTETGGIMICNLPSLAPSKPGRAGHALPGIQADILSPEGQNVETGGGLLSLTEPWPSMLRGIWGDPKRFEDVYWSRFDTYFAGDGATIDNEGYIKVLGRVDDVLNVAGHRIGTMEVESAIVDFEGVAEAAVVGIHDDIKGQAIQAFVILKEEMKETETLESDIKAFVANSIGPIARPKHIVFTPELPKTRSGKIMRRILKQLAHHEPIGDTTTLANPEIVTQIQSKISNTSK
ncbi:acetate--CoA ligase [Candidatus Marinamargulisbacteria bacterium SCGC AG-410-N11]|nr:acetate--CoA ligase [Candidatus Marinamargulisbacteria bacterium SCGC AG-410-N11]